MYEPDENRAQNDEEKPSTSDGSPLPQGEGSEAEAAIFGELDAGVTRAPDPASEDEDAWMQAAEPSAIDAAPLPSTIEAEGTDESLLEAVVSKNSGFDDSLDDEDSPTVAREDSTPVLERKNAEDVAAIPAADVTDAGADSQQPVQSATDDESSDDTEPDLVAVRVSPVPTVPLGHEGLPAIDPEEETPILVRSVPDTEDYETPVAVEAVDGSSAIAEPQDYGGARHALPLQQTDADVDTEKQRAAPEPLFEDLTLAEVLDQLRRAPITTLRALVAVSRTPVAVPPRTPALRPAYASSGAIRDSGVMLPGLYGERPALPSDSIPEVPQIDDSIGAGREAIQLVLRVIAFVLAWWGTLKMVSSLTRSEADGLNVGIPYLLIGFGVWLVSEIIGGRGAKTTLAPEEAPGTPVSMTELAPRLVMLVFAIALGGAAVGLTTGNLFTFGGVAAWLGSIVIGAWAVIPLDWWPLKALENFGRMRLRLNWVFVALVVITLVGAYFRLNDLNLLPAEMTSDHVEMLIDGQRVLSGNPFVFFAGNGGREAAQFYALALFSQLRGLGLNFSTLKLLNAVEGILTIPILYWMGRAVIGERERRLGTMVGLLVAAFVAVSYWHVILSRIGERIVLMPLVTALLIIFLARALRYNRRTDFVLAGLALGVGLYTYQAFRLMPLVIAAGGVIGLFFYMRRGQEVRRLVLNLAALGFVAFLIYLPLFSYSLQYPEDYWRRTSGRLFGDEITQTTDAEGNLIFRQATIQERVDAFQQNIPALMNNIRNALLMYNWKGDVAWVQNYPNEPAFDPITGGLIIVGAAAWIGRMLRRRDPFAWVFPVMFLIMLLPSALAIAQPIENPSFTRMSGTLPLAYLLVALALALMLRSAMRLIGGSVGALVAGIAAMGLVVGSYVANQNTYFGDYYQSYLAGSYPYSEAGQHLRSFGEAVGYGNVFIINRPAWWDHRAVGISAGRLDFPNGIPALGQVPEYLQLARDQGAPYTLDVDSDIQFFYAGDDTATHQWLLSNFPNGFWQLIQSYQPEDTFYIFRVPALGAEAFEAFIVDSLDEELSQYSG
jgi:hypothetical protein